MCSHMLTLSFCTIREVEATNIMYETRNIIKIEVIT